MNNYLYHHGVKGMKWGVRKDRKKSIGSHKSKPKRHIGIDDRGYINLIEGKTTTKGKRAFARNTLLSVSIFALSKYISKHPQIIEKGYKAVQDVMRKTKTVADTSSISRDIGPIAVDKFGNVVDPKVVESILRSKGL